MRSFAAALLVLAAGCATAKPEEPPSIVGEYLLTRIDNRALPTYSPTEPNVTVLRGTLILGRAGAFALTLTARSAPQFPPEERSIRGAYELNGDAISVTPGDGSAAPIVYRIARAGIRLTLRDEHGHRYEFNVR
jgi:hypothetical protein